MRPPIQQALDRVRVIDESARVCYTQPGFTEWHFRTRHREPCPPNTPQSGTSEWYCLFSSLSGAAYLLPHSNRRG